MLYGDLEAWDVGGQGGSRGRGYMHMYADLLCCTAETSTVL